MERKISIEEETIYHEDYQMRMLMANDIEGFLTVKGRGADGKSYYDYNVSGKISVKSLYERSEIKSEDIKKFLENLLSAVKEIERHLLNIHNILLKPEYIFYEEGEYYFCYYPPGGGNLWDAFHTLTEYFVKRVDYKDEACVQMVFLLHKETMEENYSLEKLAEKCIGPKEERVEKSSEPYDKEEHDWITGQELGSSIMEETENMWTPVKRFLNRHRKPRWGDWDGLYIEEEEL